MKRILTTATFLICSLLTTFAQFNGSGSGTEENPYVITNADELYSVRNFLNNTDVWFSMTCDIDLSSYTYGSGWEPIGDASSPFKGKIDGNGYKITGLEINKSTKNDVGLFGCTYRAVIKNLTVEGNVKGNNYVGGITGKSLSSEDYVEYENVSFKGTVQGNIYVGGIAGYDKPDEGYVSTGVGIEYDKCSFSGTISGKDYVGGIVGGSSSIITNSSVDATINANQYVGGISGDMRGGMYNMIKSCYVSINLSATSGYIGGISGNGTGGDIMQCGVNGQIETSGDKVGGLIGYAHCYSGQYHDFDISDSYFVGSIKANDYVGGIIGYNGGAVWANKSTYKYYGYVRVENNYVNASISGHDKVGGILSGYTFSNNPIIQSNVCICTTIDCETENVGRIQANRDGATPNKCYSLYSTKVRVAGVNISEEQIETNISLHGTDIDENNLRRSTFYQGLSWDFESVWDISENQSYPTLQALANFPSYSSIVLVNNIILNKSSVELILGETVVISPTITPDGATNKELSWESSNNDVATVSNGVVTAVGEGSATITATTTDGSNLKASCEVTVSSQGDVPMVDDTDISQLANAVYIESTEVKTGSQMTLSIKMKNETPIRGFQFDLYLPDGVTVAKNAKDRIMASLSSGRLPEDDEHSLTTGELTDGAIRFLCSSLYDENFTGNDGEIVTLTVNVSDDMEDGDYPIIIKNARLTETDISKYYIIDYVKSTLTVSSYMLGDINADNEVDVRDYTGVANHIMGNTPDGFVVKAGDVDENGDIDVRDYTGIANIIMGYSVYGSTHNSVRALKNKTYARVASNIDGMDNVIYATNTKGAPDSQIELSICMKNQTPIRGFQFDLHLPEGVSVVKNAKGRIMASLAPGRLPEDDEHTLVIDEVSDGVFRFLCSSLYDENFTGNEGEIVTLTVNIDANMVNGDYAVLLKNIVMTETDISKFYKVDNIESVFTVEASTGVSTLQDELLGVGKNNESPIYSIDGQLVGRSMDMSKSKKGIYIRDGKKIVVK